MDRLRRQVHEREVEGAEIRPDVLRRDCVDVPFDVARERLLVQLLLVALGGGHALEVVERELGIDRQQPSAGADDDIDPLAGLERVLQLVGVGREPVAQEVLEQQLAEAAAGLGRPQRLLELAELLRALDHLPGRLRHLAETVVDLGRRLRRGRQPRVQRLLEPLQAKLELRIACRQLPRGSLLHRAEVVRGPLLHRAELAAEQARQEDCARCKGCEQHENDGDESDHGAQNPRDAVGRTTKTPAPTNPKVHRNRLAEPMRGGPWRSSRKSALFAHFRAGDG